MRYSSIYSFTSEYRIVFRIHNWSKSSSIEIVNSLPRRKTAILVVCATNSIHLARIPKHARLASKSQPRRCTRYDSPHEHTANSPSWKIPITSTAGEFSFSPILSRYFYFFRKTLLFFLSPFFPSYSRVILVRSHQSNDLTARLSVIPK